MSGTQQVAFTDTLVEPGGDRCGSSGAMSRGHDGMEGEIVAG